MTTSDYLVIIQIFSTILMSVIGFLLKNVIQSNLDPIKNDINGMKNEIKEINIFLKEHKSDEFAHPQLVANMEEKFVSKHQLSVIENYYRTSNQNNKE